METMQVNVTEHVDGSVTAWISQWSEDGYIGKLVDTQYVDGADITNWCVFTGTEGECLIYRGLYHIHGEKVAEAWAKRLEHEAYQRFLKTLKP